MGDARRAPLYHRHSGHERANLAWIRRPALAERRRSWSTPIAGRPRLRPHTML